MIGALTKTSALLAGFSPKLIMSGADVIKGTLHLNILETALILMEPQSDQFEADAVLEMVEGDLQETDKTPVKTILTTNGFMVKEDVGANRRPKKWYHSRNLTLWLYEIHRMKGTTMKLFCP